MSLSNPSGWCELTVVEDPILKTPASAKAPRPGRFTPADLMLGWPHFSESVGEGGLEIVEAHEMCDRYSHPERCARISADRGPRPLHCFGAAPSSYV